MVPLLSEEKSIDNAVKTVAEAEFYSCAAFGEPLAEDLRGGGPSLVKVWNKSCMSLQSESAWSQRLHKGICHVSWHMPIHVSQQFYVSEFLRRLSSTAACKSVLLDLFGCCQQGIHAHAHDRLIVMAANVSV